MARDHGGNGSTSFVTFVNISNQAVTFFLEVPNSLPSYRFTLHPNGPSHNEEVPSGAALTNETLFMVVGTDSNGEWTKITITTDELFSLEKVTVTKPGNDFVLVKQRRETWFQKVYNIIGRLWRGKEEARPRPQA